MFVLFARDFAFLNAVGGHISLTPLPTRPGPSSPHAALKRCGNSLAVVTEAMEATEECTEAGTAGTAEG